MLEGGVLTLGGSILKEIELALKHAQGKVGGKE